MNYEAIAQWSQVVSSALFVIAMAWIWIRFIQPAVLAAQDAKNTQIAQAERYRDDAKAALDALRDEIDSATHDAESIKRRAAAQGELERQAGLREAREAGERALRNAHAELDRCRVAGRRQLHDDILGDALGAARAEAMRRIDGVLNDRLVSAFVSSLERAGRN